MESAWQDHRHQTLYRLGLQDSKLHTLKDTGEAVCSCEQNARSRLSVPRTLRTALSETEMQSTLTLSTKVHTVAKLEQLTETTGGGAFPPRTSTCQLVGSCQMRRSACPTLPSTVNRHRILQQEAGHIHLNETASSGSRVTGSAYHVLPLPAVDAAVYLRRQAIE